MYGNAAEKFLKLKLISLIRDDHTIDQLHHRVTCFILLVMAGFFSAKTYWGSITCWVPKEYDDDNFSPYIHQWCWISNLYRVPFAEELPLEVEDRMATHRSIDFFRWVFIMFVVQAGMFKLPNFVWRAFNTLSGINIRKVVEQSLETQFDEEKNRESNMANLALVVDRWLTSKRLFDSGRFLRFRSIISKCLFMRRNSGCFLTRLYMFVKILYVVNILVQFQILSVFLHFNYWAYGAVVSDMITRDDPWEDLGRFPRVGMCDFEVRQLQNIQRHTVQCALPINMFLEKAYAGLWFFMVILGVATIISLFGLIMEELCTNRRMLFLTKYAKWLNEDPNSGLFQVFVKKYLGEDGVFLMKLLTYNTGEILTFDLLKQLWIRFQKNYKPDGESSGGGGGGHFRFPFGRKLMKRFNKHTNHPMGADFNPFNDTDFPVDDDMPPAAQALFSKIEGVFN